MYMGKYLKTCERLNKQYYEVSGVEIDSLIQTYTPLPHIS